MKVVAVIDIDDDYLKEQMVEDEIDFSEQPTFEDNAIIYLEDKTLDEIGDLGSIDIDYRF